jgi:tRNA threonylcarbamoyladenosine biosynthesis protein TsaB
MTDLLAVETSAEACSVALYAGGEVREYFEHAPMRHAELLLPAVESLLSEAKLALSGLRGIAFGRGPGSFTSLRIGIGVVQGLAWGAGLGVVPVSSLAAAAQAAIDERTEPGSRIFVAMDARMGEVYAAPFRLREDGLVQPDGPERVCPPGSLDLPEEAGFIAVGNGFERFEALQRALGQASRSRPDVWPSAAAVCRLARNWLSGNEPLPPAAAQPVYLRDEVAAKPAAP